MEFEYLKQYISDNENNVKELLNAKTDDEKRDLIMGIIANLIDMEEDIKDEIKELCKVFKIRKTKVIEWMKENNEDEDEDEDKNNNPITDHDNEINEPNENDETNQQKQDNYTSLKPITEQAKFKLVFSQPKNHGKH